MLTIIAIGAAFVAGGALGGVIGYRRGAAIAKAAGEIKAAGQAAGAAIQGK
jgi:hypothetical protein